MQNLDWANLGFAYMKTPYNTRCVYRDGKWGKLEVSTDEYIPMHIAATCLHYGQEAFEGLKAQRGRDGRVRLFRVRENARRMIGTAKRILMAEPTLEMFEEAVKQVVRMNEDFVPPYGTGASLYIRPLLIGTGAQVGVSAAKEYTFIIFVTPVGPYFKGGEKPIRGLVMRDYDRAAPHGTGHVKVGGNYAASLYSGEEAHKQGYESVIYLDPATKTNIEEAGAANFFGIRGNSYITPSSSSILPSITNMSLEQLARDFGMTVERRVVPLAECATFEEAGACGTAAVVTSISQIDDPGKGVSYTFDKFDQSRKLRQRLMDIQTGEAPDTHGWITYID